MKMKQAVLLHHWYELQHGSEMLQLSTAKIVAVFLVLPWCNKLWAFHPAACCAHTVLPVIYDCNSCIIPLWLLLTSCSLPMSQQCPASEGGPTGVTQTASSWEHIALLSQALPFISFQALFMHFPPYRYVKAVTNGAASVRWV